MVHDPLLLGLVLGLRHASEPDHLAAVANLVTPKRGAWSAALTGATWGAGHGLALVMIGGAVIATGLRLPHGLAIALDVAVAVMLIALGTASLRQREARKSRSRGQSLLVGFIHGASGTAALTILVLTEQPSRRAAFGYLIVFAFGALLSMAALSGALGSPLGALARRSDRWTTRVRSAGALLAFAAAVLVLRDVIRG